MSEFSASDDRICLELINTVSWRNSAVRRDRLESPDDLAAWAVEIGLLDPGEARDWIGDEAQGLRCLAEVVTVRELLFRLFAAIAAGGSPSAEDLKNLNARLGPVMGRAFLLRNPEGYAWAFRPGQEPPDRILDPVLRSAADLLVSPDSERLKICADETCGWLFLDRSRNRSRRWCDMRDCGNRAKARRYYRRQSAPRPPREAPEPSGGG